MFCGDPAYAKSTKRTQHSDENLVVILANFLHFGFFDLPVLQRRRPIRPPLEHGHMTDGFCDLLNCLNTGRAGSDYRDTFTFEAHILFLAKGRCDKPRL